MKINNRILGLYLFIIFTWGLGWPATKVGLFYMSPAWYSAARLIIGTIVMLGVVTALKKFSWPTWKDLPLIFIIGILQISLYMFLANIGLTYLPAGRSSLIAYTTPLWVMPIATIIFKEHASWLRWLGFTLGLSGLLLLLSPWELNWSDPHILLGASMLLLASLSWAISILGIRYMTWTKSPLELIPWQLLIGAIPMTLLALYQEPVFAVQWSMPLILSLIYTGIIVTGLSYWSGVVINRELPTIVVSLGFLAVPVFSLIISAVFMHESITPLMAFAMGLILSGLVCMVI